MWKYFSEKRFLNGARCRQVLADSLPRAFRRATSDDEIEKYLDLFRIAYARDASFNDALQFALVTVLASPNSLLIAETPKLKPEPILLSDHELATSLSSSDCSELVSHNRKPTSATQFCWTKYLPTQRNFGNAWAALTANGCTNSWSRFVRSSKGYFALADPHLINGNRARN